MQDRDLPMSSSVRVWVVPALIALVGLVLVALALPTTHGWTRGLAAISALVWLALAWRVHLAEARKQ